ncbi:MAG: hypothetical protein D6763_00855 [Alphaproteobacteria bacterium]|nr:MAG: hypothetical protein D6763_00855 [Alphaproteobacteria bacterium]
MELYNLVLYLHILMLVFWVGTDLGVLVLAKYSQRSQYTMDQRALLLEVAMLLDIAPRICMVLSLPSGVWLASQAGYLDIAPGIVAGIFLFSFFWLALVIGGIVTADKPVGRRLKIVERVVLFGLGLVLLATGVVLLQDGEAPAWLAGKIMAFGLVAAAAEAIDRSFKLGVVAFQEMIAEGTTAEREAIVNRSFDRTALWVYAVYALVIFIGFLGAAKPI